MGIMFFENFANDIPENVTLQSRYPGSSINWAAGTSMRGFPIMRISATAAANDSVLVFTNQVERPERRVDVLMRFADNGAGTKTANAAALRICGMFQISSSSNTAITFNPVSGSGLITLNVPDVSAIQSMYVSVDYARSQLTVFVDGDLVTVGEPIGNWTMPASITNEIRVVGSVAGIRSFLPNVLSEIVIAADLPEGQMLDFNTVEFVQSSLEVTANTDFQFSDGGFLQDVDKSDPTLANPGVFAEEEGSIVYTPLSSEDYLAGKVYAAGRSDKAMYMQIGGTDGATARLTTEVTVFPAVDLGIDPITAAVTAGEP